MKLDVRRQADLDRPIPSTPKYTSNVKKLKALKREIVMLKETKEDFEDSKGKNKIKHEKKKSWKSQEKHQGPKLSPL